MPNQLSGGLNLPCTLLCTSSTLDSRVHIGRWSVLGRTDRRQGDSVLGRTDRRQGDSVLGRTDRRLGDSVLGRTDGRLGDSVLGRTDGRLGDSVLGRTDGRLGDSVLGRTDRRLGIVALYCSVLGEVYTKLQVSPHVELAAVSSFFFCAFILYFPV